MSGTKKARVDQGASGSHYAALSFIFGMGMTFALYYEISTWEDLHRAKEFQFRANNLTTAMQSGIDDEINDLQFFRDWLWAEVKSGNFEDTDRFKVEFKENAQKLRESNAGLLIVGIAQRTAREGIAKSAYPVSHVVPEKYKAGVTGLDLGEGGDPRKIVETFYLDQLPKKIGREPDVKVTTFSLPVYEGNRGDVRDEPYIHLFAIFDSRMVITEALGGYDVEGLEYHIFEPYNPNIPLYDRVVTHGGHFHKSDMSASLEYENIIQGLHHNRAIRMENDRLIVSVYPSTLFLENQESWHSTIGVALGSILTLFMAGFIGALSDRKLAVEKQVKAQLAQLAHDNRLKALGQMSAGVAHELNQPLTGIMSYAQNIADSLNGPDRDIVAAGEYTDKILAQARRVKNVMGRLKMFTRVSDPPYELLEISYIIGESISLVQQEINEAGVTLEANVTDLARLIYGNELRLEQVIINLIQNALTAVRNVDEPTIYIEARVAGRNGILIEVADNGVGLPKGSEEEVFEPFFTTSKPNEGTGLGLAICRQIIKEHGGNLTASNRPAGGAEFVIYLKSATKESNIDQ